MNLVLESPSFASNTMIPSQYTCDGENISPPLVWRDSSTTQQSYVLLMDDPDATNGDWVHWVLFNIPPHMRQLPEALTMLPNAISAQNSWGVPGYRGPCPPLGGGNHRYFFKLYALDTLLKLDASATKQDVLLAMHNHINDSSELVGLYKKLNPT